MLTLISPLLFTILQPVAEGPAPPPVEETERPVRSERAAVQEQQAVNWADERRRLQIHAGLSGAFAGAMLVTGLVLMLGPDGCDNINCELNYGRVFTGVGLVALAPIPTATGIYWGVRLHRHKRQQPTAILRPGAGGFVLQF